MATPSRRGILLSSVFGFIASHLPAFAQKKPADTEWRHYGGDLANRRYAPLDQINGGNFNDLEVAWRFKADFLGNRPEYQFESTPLVVKGRIFTTAGSRRDVVALDARNGEVLWLHRIDEGERGSTAPRQLSGHGVSYWTDGKEERILFVTPGYRLIALDAATGQRIKGFGVGGIVDLRLDDDQEMDLVHGDIGLHATPLVTRNVVIVGAAHRAGNVPQARGNVKGYVRSFDVRTGRRKWIFHTIPRKGEYGYDSWIVPGQAEKTGNAGCWAEISADEELGLAYLPIELPTGDYNGQYRAGNALFGESIVAVDIETGQRKWHYQLVHHGLWDHDIPCAPILLDVTVDGKAIKALAQPTKQCFLYVLDRATGKPVWPIPEVPVAAGDVPGEWYSPTQPWPSKPPAYGHQGVKIDDLIDFTPELREEAVKLVSRYKIGPLFTPPVLSKTEGPLATLFSPGANGGTDWPGGAADPETGMVYVFSQTTVQPYGIIKNPDPKLSDFEYINGTAGQAPRQQAPMGSAGREVLRQQNDTAPPGGEVSPAGFRVLNVRGLPLLKPPYGTLAAIDLTKGDLAWQVAHGETPDNIRNHPALKGLKIPRTGRPGLLGPLATKSLVICGEAGFFTTPAGVRGAMLRAYDKKTGEEKGAVYMPAPQTGSPMSYMLDGAQYLVVAIGGGNYSAELLAFRLPRG